MKKKVGRPQKEIKTKRVQCIIPETVLDELDDKIKQLPKNERDRSKIITTAINEWLRPNRKKRVKNLYLKFFGFRDSSLDKGLWGDLNTVVEKDSDLDILLIIQKKIILGESPNDNEIELFNKLLAKQKFYIDKSLRLNCSSNLVRILTEKLFLNKCYPLKDYAGYCKECGVFFYKEKAKQLFHSPVCKLKYYDRIKKNRHTPQKESLIIANERNVRDKLLKERLNITEILRAIGSEKNAIETVKELIKSICIVSGNKFSIFKELWQNGVGKLDEFLRLSTIFYNDYIEELIRRHTIKGDISVLKNYTVDNLADDMANDFFPEIGRMRIQFKKWLLKSLTPNRFNARRDLILGSSYLKKDQDCINALNKTVDYYQNTFEKEYSLNNDKQLTFEKKNNLILAKTFLIRYEKDLDKRINLYVELLNENRLNLGAYAHLILTYFEKDVEKYKLKIIYYYKCFSRIKKALGILKVNKINSERRIFKELSTCPIFLKTFAILTVLTSLVLIKNEQPNEALEILTQPDVKYITDEEKDLASEAYVSIFCALKNSEKGIEALESLDLKPEIFKEKKKKLLERIEKN